MQLEVLDVLCVLPVLRKIYNAEAHSNCVSYVECGHAQTLPNVNALSLGRFAVQGLQPGDEGSINLYICMYILTYMYRAVKQALSCSGASQR